MVTCSHPCRFFVKMYFHGWTGVNYTWKKLGVKYLVGNCEKSRKLTELHKGGRNKKGLFIQVLLLRGLDKYTII